MKNEEIKTKLVKLKEIYEKLKALRTSKGEVFDEEAESLLSQAQLIEEALKNYMYQFGLSIYRNKKGKRFFKKFIHDEDEVRGFDELDTQCFDFLPAEPSFWQRLFDFSPDDQLLMKKDVEETVEYLYEKDPMMSEIMDELVHEEAEKCEQIIKEFEIDNDIEKAFEIANKIQAPEIEIEIDENDASIGINEIENEIEQDIYDDLKKKKKKKRISPKLQNSFVCGTKTIDQTSKVKKTNSEEPALREARKGRQNQR
ncbi:MAG: hypothetical protein J6Y53_00810 [Alphaproteobacteria bacterium]|nr:hypothetical protein [Alphaproteobacteria bacterium]